jgi:hypothetical protein
MSETRSAVLKRESEKTQVELVVANVVAFVVFPAIIGILGAFSSDIHKAHSWLAFLLWAIVLMFFGLFWWRAYPSPQSLLKLIRENERNEEMLADLIGDIDGLEQSINLLAFQSAFSLSTRGMIATYVTEGVNTLRDLEIALSEICSPLCTEGELLFGFGGSEKWNFACYMYSESKDLLVPVWRDRSRTHPSSGMGRNWGRGQGHVGKTFVDAQTIITGDALHPDVAQLCSAPKELEASYDSTIYRSFASVPIGPLLAAENRPYGVLVGTSDRESRFDKENAAMLEQTAGVIGSLIILAKANFDRLATESAKVKAEGARQ